MKVRKCVSEKHSLSLTGPQSSLQPRLRGGAIRPNAAGPARASEVVTLTHSSPEENSAAHNGGTPLRDFLPAAKSLDPTPTATRRPAPFNSHLAATPSELAKEVR